MWLLYEVLTLNYYSSEVQEQENDSQNILVSPRQLFGQHSVCSELFDFLKMDVLLRGETSERRLLCRQMDGERTATANGRRTDGERSLYERSEQTAITSANVANER